MNEIKRFEKELAKAERALEKASKARAGMPPGSTRARITTANARWSSAAEHKKRIQDKLDELKGD